jgi:hypothetical protein
MVASRVFRAGGATKDRKDSDEARMSSHEKAPVDAMTVDRL